MSTKVYDKMSSPAQEAVNKIAEAVKLDIANGAEQSKKFPLGEAAFAEATKGMKLKYWEALAIIDCAKSIARGQA